jgi:hypothetical protein
VPEILQISQVVWIIWSNILTYQTVVISNRLAVGRRDHTLRLRWEIMWRKEETTTTNAHTATVTKWLTDIHKTVITRTRKVKAKPDNTNGETITIPSPSGRNIDLSAKAPKNF